VARVWFGSLAWLGYQVGFGCGALLHGPGYLVALEYQSNQGRDVEIFTILSLNKSALHSEKQLKPLLSFLFLKGPPEGQYKRGRSQMVGVVPLATHKKGSIKETADK
jgi:hypothetical protein